MMSRSKWTHEYDVKILFFVMKYIHPKYPTYDEKFVRETWIDEQKDFHFYISNTFLDHPQHEYDVPARVNRKINDIILFSMLKLILIENGNHHAEMCFNIEPVLSGLQQIFYKYRHRWIYHFVTKYIIYMVMQKWLWWK